MADDDEEENEEERLPDLAGTSIGKYAVVQLLGRGGMGRVYEAINPTIKKRVAIKILDPEYAKKRDTAMRFTREAQAASAAESPHIVEIFDAGFTEEGVAFIVMELLRGESLADRLKREGVLEPGEAKRIAVQIVRGLAKAHDARIVHRDLKPDNIFLVDRDPDPPFTKILDFGISKIEKRPEHTTLTREGVVLGTPWYMSPEQAQGQTDVDARSDIWSVGAMLYQCLTGALPFSGNTYEQIIVRICTTDPPPISELVSGIPEDLAEIVHRCLRRDKGERIASASELLALLGDPSMAIGKSRTPVRPVRRREARAVDALSPIHGADSTAEAPAVHVGARTFSVPPSRTPTGYKVVLGLMLVALSGGLLFVLMSNRSDPGASAASASGQASAAASAAVPATRGGPIRNSATVDVIVTNLPSGSLGQAASSGSEQASSSPSAVATAIPGGAGGHHRHPAAKPSETSAPAPTPATKPTGVAGDLEIQRR